MQRKVCDNYIKCDSRFKKLHSIISIADSDVTMSSFTQPVAHSDFTTYTFQVARTNLVLCSADEQWFLIAQLL